MSGGQVDGATWTLTEAVALAAASASVPANCPSPWPTGAPPSRVLVISSLAWSLVNFRGRLLADMVHLGHEVIAAAPDNDPAVVAALEGIGVRFVRIPMQRTGQNILSDLGTLRALYRVMRVERPDVVLAYTQKPIVYGGIAARLAGVRRYFAMVSGLGYAFTEAEGEGRRLLRWLVARLYQVALARASGVFVFNSDDAAEMQNNNMLRPGQRVVQLGGSGVDMARFPHTPLPKGPPVFLMVARLMLHKGVREFAMAARIVRASHPAVRCQLLGPMDSNPSGLSEAELAGWQVDGTIEYLGHTRDVAPYLAAASVFVLPTWYREGLPRTILEAMASGRAVIATDAPGCRDAVRDGDTGFLVPVRDGETLAQAMLKIIETPGLAAQMGARGRAVAEREYDVAQVNRRLLGEMGLWAPETAARTGIAGAAMAG